MAAHAGLKNGFDQKSHNLVSWLINVNETYVKVKVGDAKNSYQVRNDENRLSFLNEIHAPLVRS